jgi:hypothetical protein
MYTYLVYRRALQQASHIQTRDWLKPEMVSIGLTLTSLFISGENGLQPMDDEEKNMASHVLFV